MKEKKERNDLDNWEYFVVEESKLMTEETKIFDAIMDAGAAAKKQGIKDKFPFHEYIKEEQTERFNERLEFRILLLNKEKQRKRGKEE